MPKENSLAMKILPGQERYVDEIDETGLGAVDAVADESAPSSLWGEAWKQLRRRPLFWVSAIIIAIVVVMALFPSLFTSEDPSHGDLSRSLGASQAGHIFGFTFQGYDIYARLIYGARASIAVGVCSTLLSVLIGVALGALAGYFGGILDAILSRVVDIFFAIPMVLAAIVVMQMFKESRSIWMVVIVLGAFGWTQIARITRGAVMSIKHEEYVTSAKSLGVGHAKILLRHILPNAAAPVIVYATVALGTFIVAEATLSFMGIGLPTSIVSWGGDISDAQSVLRQAPLVLFYPSCALAVTVLSFIMLGDVVRDALDPNQRKR